MPSPATTRNNLSYPHPQKFSRAAATIADYPIGNPDSSRQNRPRNENIPNYLFFTSWIPLSTRTKISHRPLQQGKYPLGKPVKITRKQNKRRPTAQDRSRPAPLPLIAIGIGVAAAASGAVTVSQTIRSKKRRKVYQEAYAHAEAIQNQLEHQAADFNRQAENYGRAKAEETVYLQKAVDFLEKAKLKHRDFQVGTAPEKFQTDMERIELQTQLFQAVLRTASGPAAAAAVGAPAGIYAAVGLFGTASTGTAIGSLSGTAAHSATMAAIGRMIGIGGAGMAAGSAALAAITTTLNIVALPISLGADAWSVKKGNDVKTQVEAELKN